MVVANSGLLQPEIVFTIFASTLLHILDPVLWISINRLIQLSLVTDYLYDEFDKWMHRYVCVCALARKAFFKIFSSRNQVRLSQLSITACRADKGSETANTPLQKICTFMLLGAAHLHDQEEGYHEHTDVIWKISLLDKTAVLKGGMSCPKIFTHQISLPKNKQQPMILHKRAPSSSNAIKLHF